MPLDWRVRFAMLGLFADWTLVRRLDACSPIGRLLADWTPVRSLPHLHLDTLQLSCITGKVLASVLLSPARIVNCVLSEWLGSYCNNTRIRAHTTLR